MKRCLFFSLFGLSFLHAAALGLPKHQKISFGVQL